MRRLTCLAVLLMLPLFAGCGSDGEKRADTVSDDRSTTTRSEKQDEGRSTPLTQDDLEGALLTIDDMPTGWAGSPPEDDSDDDFCDDAPELVEPKIEAEASYQEDEFGPIYFEAIGVYDDANAYMDKLEEVVDACRSFTDVDDEGTETTGSIQPLSFPKLGEETFAMRASGEGGGFSFSGDFVIIRLSDDLIMMSGTVGIMGGGADNFEQLTRTAFERAKRLA
jgi:hypothetical protein